MNIEISLATMDDEALIQRLQNRLTKPAQHRLQRPVCNTPSKGFFLLENIIPSIGLYYR